MRTLLFSIIVLATTAFAANTNTFFAYKVLDLTKGTILTNSQGVAILCHMPILDAAKTGVVSDGVTLGQTVDKLGSGWMSPVSGVNAIHWSFNDGRELVVFFPNRYSSPSWQESFVLRNKNSATECHVWWLTNSTMCFTNQPTRK